MSNNNNLKFTINNFRIFDKPHTFELAPITILTGPNNSGKSSFVKALLMLKNEKNAGEIPFQINLPNKSLELPGVQELLNNVNESFDFKFSCLPQNFDISVSFERDLDIKLDPNLYLDTISVFCNNKIVLDIYHGFVHNDKKFRFDFSFWIKYLRNSFSARKSIEDLNLNNKSFNEIDYLKKYEKTLLFELEHDDEVLGDISPEIKLKFIEIQNQLIKNIVEIDENHFDKYLKNHFQNYRFRMYAIDKNFFSLNSVKSFFEERFLIVSTYYRYELLKQINVQMPGNFKLKETEFFSHFLKFSSEFIKLVGMELSDITGIEVLPISKGYITRYFQPENSVNSFLANASIFFEKSILDYSKYDEFRSWLNKWMVRFELGKSLEIINIENRDIYTIEIIDFRNKKRNIKDLGFGVSQVVSLLLLPIKTDFEIDEVECEKQQDLIVDKYYNIDKTPVFYIEEPESNLHPNWQSLLMELITEINQKFGIRFIIETHSEYMIRKLQFLMADKTKNLETDSALIYYFNSDKNVDESKGEPKIKKIKIDKNGGLSDNFGPGFYDEAINLEFDLLKLRNYQKN